MNSDTIGYDGLPYLAINKCVDYKRELWFDLRKCMWRKHLSVYQDHMKYVRNDIVKPFKVKILRYAKRVQDMHELAKHLPPPPMKGESVMAANWSVRNKEFTTSHLQLSIRDGLPKSMRDELDDHPEDYCYLTYEYIFVTFSPPLRLKMKGKGQQVISIILPIPGQPLYPTAMNP